MLVIIKRLPVKALKGSFDIGRAGVEANANDRERWHVCLNRIEWGVTAKRWVIISSGNAFKNVTRLCF